MSESKHDADRDGHRPTHLTTVTLSAEQFESLYMQPRIAAAKFSLASTLGNPTPIGITAFLLGLLPLSWDLMEFQGASVASAITLLGAFYGLSGIGCYIAAIMEFIVGNTFPSIVFAAFGGFWISYAIVLQPSFEVAASFATGDAASNSVTAIAAGSATVQYNSGLALYFLGWCIMMLLFFLAATRTNLAFAGMLGSLTVALGLISAAYFHIGHGKTSQGMRELKAGGAFLFIVGLLGIWANIALLFASVGFPIRISLIDLSTLGHRQKSEEDRV